MLYKFIFLFTDRDHEFLIQCLHLLTRYQVLLQEENSTDPEVLKESLQDPQHSEVLSSLKVSDCLRIQDVLSTGQHCCHPWRVKTMKTEQRWKMFWSLIPLLLTKRTLYSCRHHFTRIIMFKDMSIKQMLLH